MARYDFRCHTCRIVTEASASIAARDLVVIACPVCGGRMTRQPAAPAFKLKGPGFYKTDYDTGERHKVEE
jgi:putative FmdB family regulatory protein